MITFVVFASGLKYVGVGTTALGWILCAVLLGAGLLWVIYIRPREKGAFDTGPLAPASDAQEEDVPS